MAKLKLRRRVYVNSVSSKEILFFLSYSIFMIYMILSQSFFFIYIHSLWKPVFVLCVILLAMSEYRQNKIKYRDVTYISIAALIILNIIFTAQGMNQNAIVCMILYMYNARSISFRRIAIVTILITGFCFAFVLACAYLGIIQNFISEESGRRREYLGFRYALYPPSLVSNLIILWIYLRKEKFSLSEGIFFFLVNFVLFKKCDGRLCFCLTVLMLFVAFIYRRWGAFFLRRRLFCWIMVTSFLIACFVSIFMTIHYDPTVEWQFRLNRILENRLSLGRSSIEQIGYGLFGIEGINWVGAGLDMYGEQSAEIYSYVDCFYIQILQRFGALTLAVALLIHTVAAFKAYKTKDIYLLTIFASLAWRFVLDDLYMYLHYNTFWLAVGILVFRGMRFRGMSGWRFSRALGIK